MTMKIVLGPHNTGCERKTRDILAELTKLSEPELGHKVAEALVTIAHQAQPRFDTIGVILDVRLGTDAAEHLSRKEFTGSFTITLDEVRAEAVKDMLKQKWEDCIAKLKAFINEITPDQVSEAEQAAKAVP